MRLPLQVAAQTGKRYHRRNTMLAVASFWLVGGAMLLAQSACQGRSVEISALRFPLHPS
jgi:hypothetical protein